MLTLTVSYLCNMDVKEAGKEATNPGSQDLFNSA